MSEMFANLTTDRSNISNYALIITDGKSQDRPDTYSASVLLRESGVFVMTIGVEVLVSSCIFISLVDRWTMLYMNVIK